VNGDRGAGKETKPPLLWPALEDEYGRHGLPCGRDVRNTDQFGKVFGLGTKIFRMAAGNSACCRRIRGARLRPLSALPTGPTGRHRAALCRE
jgi:hypothetical protein